MPAVLQLSELMGEIDDAIRQRFAGRLFWIKAAITDVKKYPDKRWCFLKFIEKEGHNITSEMKGVFWSATYHHIENFERETQQVFSSGLEITCTVRVRFHQRFGLDLEVMAIDFAYAVGQLELERKQTIERLLKENVHIRLQPNGSFSTFNNRLPLPTVFQRIALVTAPNSDGYRDFTEVMGKNKYGYAFSIQPFFTQVQGDAAATLIMHQLSKVKNQLSDFDVVVIVRGGGSDTDFKSFNSFDLCNYMADFTLPILTGIGHDRNTSIADMVARQHKTPTEVATYLLDGNMSFEKDLLQLKERFFNAVDNRLQSANQQLTYHRRIIISSSPHTILKRGFAMLMKQQQIVTNPALLQVTDEVQVILKDTILQTTINKKESNVESSNL